MSSSLLSLPIPPPPFVSVDQVYKVVIEWSNDSTVIIYRRYTHFFDFLVSLCLPILYVRLN